MIACAARPGLFERRPHWGEGQAFHRRLGLEPLTKRNTRRLLDEILQKVENVPETLSELVVIGAEGNPFFVEELIKMLLEDGVIVKGEEHWRVEPSRQTQVRVPSSLTGVLQARLDRVEVRLAMTVGPPAPGLRDLHLSVDLVQPLLKQDLHMDGLEGSVRAREGDGDGDVSPGRAPLSLWL